MIKINLLGDALTQSPGRKDRAEPEAVYAPGEGSKKLTLPIAGILVGLLFASAGGVYYIYLSQKVEEAERKKAELEKTKQSLEKYIQLEKQYREQKEALEKKKQVIVGLRIGQHMPVHLLQELADCLPDDVWIKDLAQRQSTINIQGESTSFEAINAFRNRLLEQTKYFAKVNYPTATKKGRIVEFTISFDIKGQG